MARLKRSDLFKTNLRAARLRWGPHLPTSMIENLRNVSNTHHLSVLAGDIIVIGSSLYVTHGGLLHLARRTRCNGISVRPLHEHCDAVNRRWAFEATVYKSAKCRGFVGYGDADPTNVSALVRGAEMRVAETRAVNRALRKAYGIGLCSVEEIGSTAARSEPPTEAPPKRAPKSANNGNGTSSTLRDRLTLLIRQHQLDPGLVKLYAADFCGVHELRGASRELVEDFVNELAAQAVNDRTSLLCKLNSYAPKQGGAA